MKLITAYTNYWATDKPFYITIEQALERIKNGASKDLIELIRNGDQDLKKYLPCILFSGKFSERKIAGLLEYSNFICLDFDKVDATWKEYLKKINFIYAAWISPSGNGVKAIVKVSTDNHLGHFQALSKEFHNLDKSGKDVSRICFESYDPDIYINPSPSIFAGEEDVERRSVTITTPETNEERIYGYMKRWAEKHGEYFIEGNRNNFITRMAAFGNRAGISEASCKYFLGFDYGGSSDFTREELDKTVTGVYKRYGPQFGTAQFEKEEVVNVSTGEVYNSKELLEADIEIEDVIYFSDVYQSLKDLREHGQLKGETTHFPELDIKFRHNKKEVTVIGGYGNAGKSTFITQLDLIKAKKDGKKYCVFSPENYPTEHYYKDIVQMYVGKSVEKGRYNSMSDLELEEAYDFVNEHFFYVYPKNDKPTPDYILKRFTEVKIKHNVDGVLIDPFNQLSNAWGARDDKYLEEILPKFKRFAQNADVYFRICAHPVKPSKNKNGEYEAPTYFDLAGGAMWSNMADNILAYHRPLFFIDKMNPLCEIHSQKIKKQQMTGILGTTEWHYDYASYRFREKGFSPLDAVDITKRIITPNTSTNAPF